MFGGVFDKIIGNAGVIKAALGGVKSSMEKDGVSCIILQLDPSAEGDTPGLSVKSFNGAVGILTGDDLGNYLEWIRGASLQDAAGKLVEKEVPHV